MGLLSFGFGSTGAAVGHSQNLWKFSRDRWEPPVEQGGGGNAPPRFFSSALWGTIVYPDETALLSNELRAQILTPSQFCGPVRERRLEPVGFRKASRLHFGHAVRSE